MIFYNLTENAALWVKGVARQYKEDQSSDQKTIQFIQVIK